MTEALVLIDTSAWIRFFEPGAYGEPQVADEVEQLILSERACYSEPIYLEIAAGAGSEKRLHAFEEAFSALPLKSVCSEEIWASAAGNYPALIKKGFKKRAIDVLIATVAQFYRLTLFHHDNDYRTIAKAIRLKEYSFLK